MKKILVTFFQLAVTIAVLYWVYHDPNRRAQMGEALRHAHYSWVLLDILAYIIVEIAAAFRWHVLLKVQGIHLSFWRLSGLFLIGMFYNQFLPGGTGGDIIKSYYLLKETSDKKAGALLAVVFDRFIGLVALVAITGTLISLRYDFLSQKTDTRRLLWVLLFLLGASVVTLLSTFVISGVPEGTAILIGSLSFLVVLVCCLPGALVYFLYKPSVAIPHAKLREMEQEVVTLEHEISEAE